jgi:hypothetical protein
MVLPSIGLVRSRRSTRVPGLTAATLNQPAHSRAKLAPVPVWIARLQAVLSGSKSANWFANRPAQFRLTVRKMA